MDDNPPRNPERPCQYVLRRDDNMLTMEVGCLSCNRRELKDRNCFSALLRAFANEVNVDKVKLMNTAETEYFGRALAILKGITALSYEMRQLSLRDPHDAEGRKPDGCATCEYRPQDLFRDMNETFLQDVGLFYSYFHDKTVQLYEADGTNYTCGECMLATRQDFDYIYSRFETLLRDIVKEGYAVVV